MTEACTAAKATRGALGHSAGEHTPRLKSAAIVVLGSAICGGEFTRLQNGTSADVHGVYGGAKLAEPHGLSMAIAGEASGAANLAAPEALRYSPCGGVGNA